PAAIASSPASSPLDWPVKSSQKRLLVYCGVPGPQERGSRISLVLCDTTGKFPEDQFEDIPSTRARTNCHLRQVHARPTSRWNIRSTRLPEQSEARLQTSQTSTTARQGLSDRHRR